MNELFDKLERGTESDIKNFVDIAQQENVLLDFKLKEDSSHGNFSDADKRTQSEALSGFSNSAGGTLIWGVDARKGTDGYRLRQRTSAYFEYSLPRSRRSTGAFRATAR